MKTFRLLLLFLFGAFAQVALAQISGTVVDDATGKPLERALVSILKDGKTVAYVSTKADGEFVISKIVEEPYTISIRRLSYTTITVGSDTYKEMAKKLFRLKEKGLNIKPIVVTAPHVRQKGDTTSYTLSSFTSKSDVSLEDAIKKLPGVTVSASGSISYLGRSISKLTIEGEDLLGKQYTNATKNLSKKMVKTVQILENQQEIKQLQGIVGDDKIVMNLILNDAAKNKINGRVDGGIGIEQKKPLYYGNATGMFFGQGLQLIGSLSLNKGIKEKGTFHSDLGAISPLHTTLSASDSHRAGISEKFYIERKDLLSNLNVVKKLKNDARFRVIADFRALKEKHDVSSKQKFFTIGSGADDVEISEDLGLSGRDTVTEVKARYYKNDKNIYFNNNLIAAGNVLNKRISIGRSGSEPFDENHVQKRFSIGNHLSIVKNVSGNFLSFSAKIQADRYPLWLLNSKDLVQNLSGQSHLLSSELSFSRGLPKGWRLDIPAKVEWRQNKLFPATTWKGEIERYDVSDHTLNFSLSPGISKFKQGYYNIFLRMPLNFTTLSLGDKALVPKDKGELLNFFVNPYASLSYIFSNSLSAGLSAHLTQHIGGAEMFYPGLYFHNHRSAMRMPGMLSKSKRLGASGQLTFKKGLQEFFASMYLNYNRGETNLLSSDSPTPDINISEKIPGRSAWDSYGVSGNISKYFRTIHTKLSLTADYLRNNNEMIRKGIEHRYTSNSLRGSLFLASNPLSWLEIGYTITPNWNILQLQGGKRSALLGFSQDINMTLHPLTGFEISAKGEHLYRDLTANQSASLLLLGGMARYKYDRYIFSFVIENLLDKRVFAYTIHDALQSYSASYPLRGRSLRLEFSYYF
ncbi:MAG: carboxypeptidase regulatory-like domain-containing protein [Porphyromonas sp.]|nr:carboxypeptidase regulatory-like domain-containing protein [Porphyromonas sp.]